MERRWERLIRALRQGEDSIRSGMPLGERISRKFLANSLLRQEDAGRVGQ
jgi:hypothetical protein